MPNLHEKKIFSRFYSPILEGKKTFEIRKEDDCFYSVGDFIKLNECDDGVFSGRSLVVEIIYKLDIGPDADGFNVCIMSIRVEDVLH